MPFKRLKLLIFNILQRFVVVNLKLAKNVVSANIVEISYGGWYQF